jgi:hypothetical protein
VTVTPQLPAEAEAAVARHQAGEVRLGALGIEGVGGRGVLFNRLVEVADRPELHPLPLGGELRSYPRRGGGLGSRQITSATGRG